MSLERIATFLFFFSRVVVPPTKMYCKKYASNPKTAFKIRASSSCPTTHQHSSSRETRRRKRARHSSFPFLGGRRLRFVAMSSFRRWSFHPPGTPKTTSSPEEAFSSPAEEGVGRTAGRNVADRRPNEEDAAFISVSFFVVLLALPIVSVFFMCARYACERAAMGREARRARARARAALRTQFGRDYCRWK